MRASAIVLFARSPEREAAAKGLRPATAVPLFRAVIAAWLKAARDADALAMIACATEDRPALAAIAPEIERAWIEQRGTSFGVRVANAARAAFDAGSAQVIVAAIDAPPPDLDAAFDALGRGLPVAGAARDGGINFIGLTSPDDEFLSQLEPRDRDVVRLCRERFANLVLLPPAVDVDSATALDHARRDLGWRGYFAINNTFGVEQASGLPSAPSRHLPARAPPAG
jgi:glycosyltransferase A (GT-A) superfamily protein (DUF2064 family)